MTLWDGVYNSKVCLLGCPPGLDLCLIFPAPPEKRDRSGPPHMISLLTNTWFQDRQKGVWVSSLM